MKCIHVAFGATVLASLVGLGSMGGSHLPHLGTAPAQAATDGRPLAAPARERLDYHGDPLPDGAVARIGTLRFRPAEGDGPCGVVFAAQGKTLISLHGRNTLYLWDLATGKEQSRLTYGSGQQRCRNLDISADGKRLAVAGQDGIQVWDLSGESPQPRWLKNPSGGADQAQNPPHWEGLAISPEGQTVACSARNKQEVFLLDADTGKQRLVVDTGLASASGRKTLFSADGKLLAVWALDGKSRTVDLWDVATGKKKQTLACPQCLYAAFAPDGRVVATLHCNQQQVPQITLWDVATGKQLHRITEGVAPAAWITFLPDGKLLEAGGGQIRFWDPATAKPCRAPVEAPALRSGYGMGYRLSPDGKHLVIARERAVYVWEVETGKPVGATTGPDGWISAITFSPDGKDLAILSDENGVCELRLWEAATGKPGRRLRLADPQQQSAHIHAQGLGYTSDGRLYTLRRSSDSGGGGGGISISLMGWDTQTGKPLDLPALTEPQRLPPSLIWAITPDGRYLARWDSDTTIRLYDLATGKEVRRLKKCPHLCLLAFSADGQSLVVGDRAENQSIVTVWDVATGRLRKGFRFVNLYGATLSPDGRWLVVLRGIDPGNACELTLWEVASGAVGPRLESQNVGRLAYAPDGRTLALAYSDGAVRLWDIDTATEIRRFAGHRKGVVALVFSPDGSRLASTSYDTTVLVWDVARSTSPKRQPGDADHPKPEALWDALSRPDAAAAHRAIWQLAETPGPAVALLRQRLRLDPLPEPAQLKRWLADLDAAPFEVRQKASAALAKCGSAIEPALRQALADQPPLEARRRIVKLLEQFDNDRSPLYLRVVRGVEVLERIGTPEARQLLAELAQLPQEHLVAREAKPVVRRLTQRRPADREAGNSLP